MFIKDAWIDLMLNELMAKVKIVLMKGCMKPFSWSVKCDSLGLKLNVVLFVSLML